MEADESNSIATVVNDWLAGFAPSTRERYRRALRHWAGWCCGRFDDGVSTLADGNRADLAAYRAALIAEGLAPATISIRLAAISSFVRDHRRALLPTSPEGRIEGGRLIGERAITELGRSLGMPRPKVVALLYPDEINEVDVWLVAHSPSYLDDFGNSRPLVVAWLGKRGRQRGPLFPPRYFPPDGPLPPAERVPDGVAYGSLSRQQAEAMIAATTDARDRAILRLILDRGLSRRQIVAADLADVGRWRGSLAQPTGAALRSWLAERGIAAGPLFVSRDPAGKGSGRLDGSTVARIVNAAGARVGIAAVSPGLLRRAGLRRSEG